MVTEYTDKYGGKRECARLTAQEWNNAMQDLDSNFSEVQKLKYIDTSVTPAGEYEMSNVADGECTYWNEGVDGWEVKIKPATRDAIGGVKVNGYVSGPTPNSVKYPLVLGSSSYTGMQDKGMVDINFADFMNPGLMSPEDKSKLDAGYGNLLSINVTGGQVSSSGIQTTFTYESWKNDDESFINLINAGNLKCKINISALNNTGLPTSFEGYPYVSDNSIYMLLTEYSVLTGNITRVKLVFNNSYSELLQVIITN